MRTVTAQKNVQLCFEFFLYIAVIYRNKRAKKCMENSKYELTLSNAANRHQNLAFNSSKFRSFQLITFLKLELSKRNLPLHFGNCHKVCAVRRVCVCVCIYIYIYIYIYTNYGGITIQSNVIIPTKHENKNWQQTKSHLVWNVSSYGGKASISFLFLSHSPPTFVIKVYSRRCHQRQFHHMLRQFFSQLP